MCCLSVTCLDYVIPQMLLFHTSHKGEFHWNRIKMSIHREFSAGKKVLKVMRLNVTRATIHKTQPGVSNWEKRQTSMSLVRNAVSRSLFLRESFLERNRSPFTLPVLKAWHRWTFAETCTVEVSFSLEITPGPMLYWVFLHLLLMTCYSQGQIIF